MSRGVESAKLVYQMKKNSNKWQKINTKVKQNKTHYPLSFLLRDVVKDSFYDVIYPLYSAGICLFLQTFFGERDLYRFLFLFLFIPQSCTILFKYLSLLTPLLTHAKSLHSSALMCGYFSLLLRSEYAFLSSNYACVTPCASLVCVSPYKMI